MCLVVGLPRRNTGGQMTASATTTTSARDTAAPTQAELAATLATRKTMLLTTFKQDGTPVGTPVSVVVESGRIFFRSYAQTWKYKRLRRNPDVEVAPATVRGKPRGPALAARARLLDGDDAEAARRALARRHPVLQRVLVPAVHRLLGYTTLHYEVTQNGHRRGDRAASARVS
jgi:PPOX class probable F420-dependent enzyme